MRKMVFQAMTPAELAFFKDKIEALLIQRGIEVDHAELLAALAEKGAVVEGQKVKFTKALIDQAVAAVPQHFTLASPSGQYDLTFPCDPDSFYTRTNTGAPNFRTVAGDVHYFRMDEVREWYHLANQLPNINFVCLPSTSGEEVPATAVDVYTLATALKHSAKHIWVQPYEAENVNHLINLAAAAAGRLEQLQQRPIISFISTSVPCLTYKNMDAEVIYQCALKKIPVQPCSLPTAGANAPVTGQGVAFIACAEVLAQIIMLELLCPGLPVIATPLLFSMDMMTTYTLQASSEVTVGRALAMQLFEVGYNIRAHSYGTGTDSMTHDEQDLMEATSIAHTMAFSGATVLGGAGQIETAKTNSPIQLIIDNELFGYLRDIRRGLAVNEDTIDWADFIEEADRGVGFISSAHTFEYFRDIYRPTLFNRDSYIKWQMDGSQTMMQRVLARYETLMAAAPVWELDAGRMAEVDRLLVAAHEALVKAV